MYQTIVVSETLSDGTPVYIASHPELPGCHAQGYSVAEAQADLDVVREEYIGFLREDGLPIPSSNLERMGTAAPALIICIAYNMAERRIVDFPDSASVGGGA